MNNLQQLSTEIVQIGDTSGTRRSALKTILDRVPTPYRRHRPDDSVCRESSCERLHYPGFYLRFTVNRRAQCRKFETVSMAQEFRRLVAINKLQKRLEIIAKSSPAKTKPIPLLSLLQEYQQSFVMKRHPSTVQVYKYRLHTWQEFLRQHAEFKTLLDVHPRLVELFKQWRRTTRITRFCHIERYPKWDQIYHDLVFLNGAFNHARRMGYWEVNPVMDLYRTMRSEILEEKTPQRGIEPWTAECGALLAACREPYRTMFTIYAKTGLRLRELQNLERQDIDLQQGHINLEPRGPLTDQRKTPNPKTEKSKRIVKLVPSLVPLIQQWLEQVPPTQQYPFRRVGDHYFHSFVINRYLKHAAKRAGVQHWRQLHVHCFRHGFITALLKRGMSVTAVQQLVGHADIRMTMQYADKIVLSRAAGEALVALEQKEPRVS